MSAGAHPATSHHLPGFITAPGETDVLMVASVVMLLAIILGIGVFYFKLHALPEQIAHKGEKIQFQLVAVLALIALFTHNHAFWIAALLLAFVTLPDFLTPLSKMSESLARIAESKAASADPAKRAAGKTAKGESASGQEGADNA